MPIFYLDTSAVMKRYRSETGSDVVAELFGKLANSNALATSELTVLEMNSALARLLESRQMTQGEYQKTLDRFARDIDLYGLTVMPVHSELVTEAISVVRGYSLRALDALHFTSAMTASELPGNQNLYMVSADRKIIEVCVRHGIPSLNPLADDALSRLRSLLRIG